MGQDDINAKRENIKYQRIKSTELLNTLEKISETKNIAELLNKTNVGLLQLSELESCKNLMIPKMPSFNTNTPKKEDMGSFQTKMLI